MKFFTKNFSNSQLQPIEEYFKLPLVRKLMGIFFIALGAGTIYITPYLLFLFKPQLVAIMNEPESKFTILLTVYGIVNTVFYLPGGWIADRMSTKSLFTISMIGTGLVTVWYSFIGIKGANVDFNQLIIIHILFSFTTVLTFWSAFVKGVKLLGSPQEQSKLYTTTETTRYSLQLIASFVSVGLSSIFIVSPVFVQLTLSGKAISGSSLFFVLIVYAAIYIITGILCLFLLPGKFLVKRHSFYDNKFQYLNIKNEIVNFETLNELKIYKHHQKKEFFIKLGQDFMKTIKNIDVWLIAFFVFFIMNSYTLIAYYGTNILATNGWNDEALRSALSTTWTYGMPIIGTILVGISIKFKFRKASRALMYVSALLLIFSIVLFALGLINKTSWTIGLIFLIFMCLSFLCIGAARSAYWVPMSETKIPVSIFGIAIGFISIIGFSKDIWVSPLMEALLKDGGYIPDTAATATALLTGKGFEILFSFLLVNSILALIVSVVIFWRVIKSKRKLVKEIFNFTHEDL